MWGEEGGEEGGEGRREGREGEEGGREGGEEGGDRFEQGHLWRQEWVSHEISSSSQQSQPSFTGNEEYCSVGQAAQFCLMAIFLSL